MAKNHLSGILIKNTARGYRNWDNLKAAILFHCGGLNLTHVSLRPA